MDALGAANGVKASGQQKRQSNASGKVSMEGAMKKLKRRSKKESSREELRGC